MKTSEALALLRATYPRQDFPDLTVAVYGRMLADLDDEAVVPAVQRLINRCTFLPSVAEIRQEVAEARLGLPSAEEAWEIARCGRLREAPAEVQAAAAAAGDRKSVV